MKIIIVTNNSKCGDTLGERFQIEYNEDWTHYDVLVHTRDLIHGGANLLTHPMAGSLKPNQTPYRSIVLSYETLEDKAPSADVTMIENSVESYNKFMKDRKLPHWPDNIKEDFKTLDLSYIQSAVNNPICTRR